MFSLLRAMAVDFTAMIKPQQPSVSPPPSLLMKAANLVGEFQRRHADGFTIAADDSLIAMGAG